MTHRAKRRGAGLIWPALLVCVFAAPMAVGAEAGGRAAQRGPGRRSKDVLSPRQWAQVDASVERGLAWLTTQQRRDGSFATIDSGQPGVTALCLMALLAGGHRPGEGPYGRQIDAGVRFVLACQKPNGLISYRVPEPMHVPFGASHTALYNHSISGLLLGEVYGMTGKARAARIRLAIDKALKLTRSYQVKRKRDPIDRGGWRYPVMSGPNDSDLSVTAWQLMFLRSAKNAGFGVPTQFVDEAISYVHRCFDRRQGSFLYGLSGNIRFARRAMAGAGILSLSLSGYHDTKMARSAGNYILQRPFDRYNVNPKPWDPYHYGAYYCTQAMFQLGGKYWSGFFPVLVRAVLAAQRADGSWDPESGDGHDRFGNAYTTALIVLALTTPDQLLPIYQR